MTDDFDGIEAQFSDADARRGHELLERLPHRREPSRRRRQAAALHLRQHRHPRLGRRHRKRRQKVLRLRQGRRRQEQGRLRAFSLEFGRSQAAGHSFNSSGVFITPTSGKMYGNTYRTDATGSFTATFKVSALNTDHEHLRLRQHRDRRPGPASSAMKNLVSQTTYTGADLSTSKDFTLAVNGVSGKQWYAIAAVSSDNQQRVHQPDLGERAGRPDTGDDHRRRRHHHVPDAGGRACRSSSRRRRS